ncbi:MAG: RNA polymerase sigma-70 factor [Runella sp.]
MLLSTQPDNILVDALQNGSAEAFEAIYRRYWRPLYGYIYQQLGSKEEAEEIVHDLMLSLWQNRSQIDIRQLQVYLFVAARNLTNKYIRSQINLRKYREYQILHEVLENIPPDQIENSDDLAQAIEHVMKQMPEKTARIFRMSKIEELPVKQIASTMQLTEKAVEYHITKSLKMLRQHLQTFYSDN